MRTRRVALLIDTTRAYGREVLRGAWHYIQEHGPWSILFRPTSFEQPLPEWVGSWDGDGIITYIGSPQTAGLLKKSPACTVDLLGDLPSGCPFVGADHRRIAEMAAEHLLERGLSNFAACGLRTGLRPGLDARAALFQKKIEEAGYPCAVFRPRGGGRAPLSWEKEQLQIELWMVALPKPVGIFACNDTRGREALFVCHQAGFHVPDEVAVLGAGNDELLCELSDERLSSIDVDPQRVGYRAAEVLDRMMAGHDVPEETLIPPRYVVARQSTDLLAVNDVAVATALRFIRRHASNPISVNDVVAQVSVERRVLERRFRDVVGRSLKSEITRTRLQRAKELLAETNLSCEKIAQRCGFGSPSYFMDLFHRKVGMTAGAFRGKRNQGRR